MEEKELISFSAAARLLKKDWTTVRRMVEKGQLEGVPVADSICVRRSEVMATIHGKQEPTDAPQD